MKISQESVDAMRYTITEYGCDTDLDGQIILFTGLYRHSDGSFHDEIEEKEDNLIDN